MNFKSMFLGLALICASVLLANQSANAAKICRVSITSNTSTPSPTRALARASAVAKWSAKVTSRHNLSWANWDNARTKNYNCWRKTTVLGTNAWRCRARAKPCKFN